MKEKQSDLQVLAPNMLKAEATLNRYAEQKQFADALIGVGRRQAAGPARPKAVGKSKAGAAQPRS